MTRLAFFLALAAPAAAQDFEPRTAFELRADFSAEAAPQIRAHLADVIALLESRDVSSLTDAQRDARRGHIARLAEYSEAGAFPVNVHAPYPTPVFIDREERYCAVGDLMLHSGADELARRIAEVQNLAYVPEIDVPGTAEWVEASGLTLDECAMIQPTYGPCGFGGSIPVVRYHCYPAAPNSGGWPMGPNFSAWIGACGSTAVADNNLRIYGNFMPVGVTGLLLCSRESGLVLNPGGSQGNLCLGGSIGRFAARPFTTFAGGWVGGEAYVTVDLTAMPQPGGMIPVLPGDTWHFQMWFRDSNPGPTSNFTSAMALEFT